MKLQSGTLANYNKGIVADNRSWLVKMRYYYSNTWLTMATEKVSTLTMTEYSVDGKNITMGSVTGSKLEFTIRDIGNAVLGNGSKIHFELHLENASVVLRSKTFIVDDAKLIKNSKGMYSGTITAYDITYLMTHNYVASASEMTCLDIVGEIATKYGLTVDSSVAEAVEAIDGSNPTLFKPLADFTTKQTLGYMAGCYGCFAYVNENDAIAFGWYTNNGKAIAKADVYENGASVSEAQSRVYRIIETGIKDNPIVYPSNASGYSVNFENPYITSAQAETIYNTKIANDLISFSVGKVKYRGDPLNGGVGTILTARQANGIMTMFVMKRTLYYDGGVYEVIESLGESESTISYRLNSPTQQRINRALSRMEEAIKQATDIITQTKGSVFEFIPIDENDPSKGNSGWKLYSTEIGSDNVILANSSGIGFSSNGGESFDAAAIYIDENGMGHINGNYITAGSISADKIDTSQLVVNKNNITGLDDELQFLLAIAEGADDKAGNASSVANSAQNTANTANTNASSALSVANTVNGVIADWCYNNDTTVIDGAKIYTGTITAKQIASEAITADKIAAGAITADKLTVGDMTNYNRVNSLSATEWGFTETNEWFIPDNPSAYNFLSDWITYQEGLSFRFTGKVRSNAVYNGNYMTFGVGFRVKKSSGSYSWDIPQNFQFTANQSKTERNFDFTHKPSTSDVVEIRMAIINIYNGTTTMPSSGSTDISNVTIRSIGSDAGNITAGKLQSADGNTFFDLDNDLIQSATSTHLTQIADGVVSVADSTNNTRLVLGYDSSYKVGGLLFSEDHGCLIAEVDSTNKVTNEGLVARFTSSGIDLYKNLRINGKSVTPAILDWGTYTSAQSGTTISFNFTFSRVPIVIATPLQSGANKYFVNVDVTSVTESSFSVYFEDGKQSDLMWIAISQ